jgi:hypothetical protein
MSGVVVERAGLVESMHRVHVIKTLGEDVGVIRADFLLGRHA